jgi:prolipoprotein diacylglyceryltransferase
MGIQFADGTVRHDLGFYEFLFLAVFVTPYVWRRRNEPAAPWNAVVAIGMRYGAFRFCLDFLRLEPRFLGLTFAQYFCLGLLLAAVVVSSRDIRWRSAA